MIDYEETATCINKLAKYCHSASVKAGWWHDLETGELLSKNKGEMIALIHSELSECLEGVRKDCMDDKLPHRKMEEVEMADVLIRIFDYCAGHGLDIGGALFEKMRYNENRPDHSPEERRRGGKKF